MLLMHIRTRKTPGMNDSQKALLKLGTTARD